MIKLYDSISYFFGVVEDRDDPMRLGRVRVRVFGLHPFQKEQGDFTGLPTDELPWMTVITPVTSASVGGVGAAPVGLLPGSHVYGHFLDKWKTVGVVVGTFYANQISYGSEMDGFQDQNHVNPPEDGPNTPMLSRGDDESMDDFINRLQNMNGGVGVNPDDGISLEENPDDNPAMTIETMLTGDEGVRYKYYYDSLGYPTIGIGHLISTNKNLSVAGINAELSKLVGRKVVNGQITMKETSELFKKDLAKVRKGIREHSVLGPLYEGLNASRRMAIENMCFQMGVGGVAKFKNTIAYMQAEEWDKAYQNMRKSKWHAQTKGRANRVALIIKNGNLESYGVAVDKTPQDTKAMRSIAPMTTSLDPSEIVDDALNAASEKINEVGEAIDNKIDEVVDDVNNFVDDVANAIDKGIDKVKDFYEGFVKPKPPAGPDPDDVERDPEGEFIQEDSRIMFVEPDTAYDGEYPYIEVRKTEGGHAEEFDNTPGKERYRKTHPSGTYTEVAGDGREVHTVVGDSYRIYRADDHVLIEGDGKVVVNGNMKVYIMGDVHQTVDGNVTQHIRGNINVIGEQDASIHIIGNSDIHVEGDANVHVEGDGMVKYDGNYDMTVSGNMSTVVNGTRTDQVVGKWNRKADAVDDIAASNFFIDGSRVDITK